MFSLIFGHILCVGGEFRVPLGSVCAEEWGFIRALSLNQWPSAALRPSISTSHVLMRLINIPQLLIRP